MHSFDPQLAAEYGVDEAIMIQSFAFWISANRTSGTNQFEGRTWTYDSREALAERHPYWKAHQIRRIVGSLIDQGVLIEGNFATKVLDRRKWYAFKDEDRFIKQASRFDDSLKSEQASSPFEDFVKSKLLGTNSDLRILTNGDLRILSNAFEDFLKSSKVQLQTAVTDNQRESVPSERAAPAETALDEGAKDNGKETRKRAPIDTEHQRMLDDYAQWCRVGKLPNYAAEGAAVKKLLARHYDSATVIRCAAFLKLKFRAQGTYLSLATVEKHIDSWQADGQPDLEVSNGSGSIRNSEYGPGGGPGANGRRGEAPGGRGDAPRRGDSRGRDLIRQWSE